MCRFVDHVTILCMLLRTCESVVIEVTINKCVVCSAIGSLSNSWASCSNSASQLYKLHGKT